MGLGSIALACVLSLAHAGPGDTWYTNDGRFRIPIQLHSDAKQIREFLLFVSHDQGKTWSVEARNTPDKDSFTFFAPKDGPYWFNIATVDKQGRQDPIDIYQIAVGQKVYVDSRKPEFALFKAERRGDEIVVQWEIHEDNPNLASLKLEYRAGDQSSSLWSNVTTTPSLQGQAAFRPLGQMSMQVRLTMNDLAGNVGQAIVDVPGVTQLASPVMPTPPPVEPVIDPVPSATGIVPPANSTIPTEPVARMSNRHDDNSGRPLNAIPSGMPLDGERNGIALASNRRQEVAPATTNFGPSMTARGSLPPIEVVNNRTAKLDFQVGKYGPSGLGSVEVYVTNDDGNSWTLVPGDRNATLPNAGDLRGGPVNASVNVDLKQEGVVYGYYIVAKSRAGLGKEPPRQGTPPQLRLELDTTVPMATLYEPKADPGRRDTLLLGWDATDKNLAANPITIEWSEGRDGPWNVIGNASMPNSGKFSWQVPSTIPPSVYLRLTVRDTAGNVAVAKTNEPVLVDLSVPEVAGITLSRDREKDKVGGLMDGQFK